MLSPRRTLLLAGLALAGCGPLPQPYRGRPGEVARRLAQPPAYRLAVPASTQVLLPDADAGAFAEALAEALTAAEIPAVATEPQPLDWLLAVTAERDPRGIVLRYALRDADGEALGMLVGQPLPERDWAAGGPVLRRTAATVAPQLADLLARVDAQRRTGDERAVGSGPPILRVLPVRGAPGDGNASLTARMRDRLAALGFQVQSQAEGAGFAVQGQVSVVPTRPGQQRVEIVWTVTRRDGHELGRVLQLNEVPRGSLNGLWGDVAFVVADEASEGVRQVVFNAGGFGTASANAGAGGGR